MLVHAHGFSIRTGPAFGAVEHAGIHCVKTLYCEGEEATREDCLAIPGASGQESLCVLRLADSLPRRGMRLRDARVNVVLPERGADLRKHHAVSCRLLFERWLARAMSTFYL